MSAHDTARMSAFSEAAMVGIDTMKIRVAMPVKNCPIIALTRSSTSVCLLIATAGGGALGSAPPSLEHDHAAADGVGLDVLVGAVDLGQRVAAGDEAGDVQQAAAGPVGDAPHASARVGPTGGPAGAG